MPQHIAIGVQARAFIRACDALRPNLSVVSQPGGETLKFKHRDIHLMIPGVVCAAFAAELAIKAMIAQRGEPVRGHELDTLFKMLPDDVRESVAERLGCPLPNIEEALLKHRKTFEHWRYSYESSTLNADDDFLLAFSVAALDYLGIPG